jgi:hypothetical protein
VKKMIGIAVALGGRLCRTPSFRTGAAGPRHGQVPGDVRTFLRERALDQERENLVLATEG